jgi:hypothetical protein
VSSTASWRKILLLNRSALLAAWPRCFPQHSFIDLRLIPPSAVPPGWDAEAWREAAQAYAAERKSKMGQRRW